MISEYDLQEAIAECKGKRNPDFNTCIKLAAFYTVKDHLYPNTNMVEEPYDEKYSYDPPMDIVNYNSGTTFSDVINGRNLYDVLEVMDDAMTALEVLNSKFHASVIRKLEAKLPPSG